MIIISENPADHDMPFNEWWPHQRHAAIQIADAIESGKRYIFLEGPTGTGKSGFPAILSKVMSPVTVLVGTRDQQQQYEESFDWFRVVWGRRHYPCVLPSRQTSFLDAYGEDPTYEDCLYSSDPKGCPEYSNCPYPLAVEAARDSQARTMNYAYAYYSVWWRAKHGRDILFCDEAHTLPEMIVGLSSIEVRENTRRKYNLPVFPMIAGSSTRIIGEAQKWSGQALVAMKKWIALARNVGGDERQLRTANTFITRLEAILNLLDDVDEDDLWYISSGMTLGMIKIRPVHAENYAERILTPAARAYVLMSATIGDHEVLASELNIPLEDIEFISLPHIIPADQRPVYFHSDAPKLSSKTPDVEYRRQADIIERILSQHPEHRGVIHTASWHHARRPHGYLAHTGRMMLAEGERIETVKRFLESGDNTVAISPSWEHGLNFKDDAARFTIVAKVPFLQLGDPVVALRLKTKTGRRWYDWNAAIRAVQACGRVVRGVDDWGYAYIVDGNWNRVKRFAPQWFQPETI